jgi:RHS repeat-associated protein
MQSESFAYDAIYNRTLDKNGSYTYDSKAQRLVEDYANFYLYDNNGNLQSKQQKGLSGEVTNYVYSSENQLLGFKVYPSGTSSPTKEVTYAYDALGRRMERRVIDHTAETDPSKTFTRRYVYDGQNISAEYDGDDRLVAEFTHSGLAADDVLSAYVTSSGVDEKIATNEGSYFYLKDAQGTITDVTDSTGAKIQHYLYSAFGKLLGIQDANAADITASPVLVPEYGYTGRELDSESGLMYYRARYYNPDIGRFLQRDPHPGMLSIPGTAINSYTYVMNNPQNSVDPSGQFIFAFIAAIVIAAIIGGLVNVAVNEGDWSKFWAGAAKGVVIGVAAVVGGAAGGYAGALVNGGLSGAAAGGITGAAVGGLFAGDAYSLTGLGSFNEGFVSGAIAGGLAGASAGYHADSGSGPAGKGPNPHQYKSGEICLPANNLVLKVIWDIGNWFYNNYDPYQDTRTNDFQCKMIYPYVG